MPGSDLLFAGGSADDKKPTEQENEPCLAKWRILIIDDEEEVHRVTKLVLRTVKFEKASLELLHAYSAKEAQEFFNQYSDIALALVDVVMETDDAGLKLIKWIRETLHNHQVRLVLRTGQPGQAPEQSVITEYDINDYKDKTELTNNKLRTLVYSTLRSYRDIVTIDRSRAGLERVINATSTIYQSNTIKNFASAVLNQIEELLSKDKSTLHVTPKVLNACVQPNNIHYDVIAATGEFSTYKDTYQSDQLPEYIKLGFQKALKEQCSHHDGNNYFGYFSSTVGGEHLMFVSPSQEIRELEKHLLDIYSTNVGIALDNIRLRDEVQDTQRELVYILGEAVEKRSLETGAHVKRVALIAELLALEYGLSEEDAALAKLTAPLHDVGKIGIPDNILGKPGKLTLDEWDIMKTHSEIGYTILSQSNKPILNKAAIIAYQHHENWDGTGYPQGLKGMEISIFARITALADVFDALGSRRCYKEPFSEASIIETITSLSGTKFEPRLADIITSNQECFFDIRKRYPD